MKRCVIYTRVSTQEQSREGVSLDHQLQKCRAMAELSDFQIIDEIVDAGRSAKNLKREGASKLIELVENKEVDVIIIFKLDRLTRNVGDLGRLMDMFLKHGVDLVSVKDSLDTGSASGRLVINILGVLSSWEREVIAERTTDAINHLKSTNQKYSKHAPFGYSISIDGKTLDQNIQEKQALEILKKKREGGATYLQLAHWLEGQGIPTREGRPWSYSSVRKILLREAA